MQVDDRARHRGQGGRVGGDLDLARFEGAQARHEAGGRISRAVGQHVDQVGNLPFDADQLVGVFGRALRRLGLDPLPLGPVGRHELPDGVGRQQLGFQAAEDALLELGVVDGLAVVADPALAAADAGEPALRRGGHGRAAPRAAHEAGEDLARAALGLGAHAGVRRLPPLRRVEGRAVDDRQVGRVGLDPVRAAVDLRDALARLGVLAERLPVEQHAADIDGVAQEARRARPAAVERRGVPLAAARTRNPLGVEVGDDRARRPAGDVFAEDAADDLGLGRLDHAMPPVDRPVGAQHRCGPVAVGETCRHAAALERPALAAPHAVPEILEVQGIHRALHPDMQCADLALVHRDEAAIGEAEHLERRRGVRLVARETVERLDDHDVEAARAHGREQRLVAGPVVCA